MHYHKSLGQRVGLSSEQIEALDRYTDSSAFSKLEKAAIAFAEQFSAKATVDATIMNELKEALSPEELVKLAAAVGQANWTNRFNNTFGIELP